MNHHCIVSGFVCFSIVTLEMYQSSLHIIVLKISRLVAAKCELKRQFICSTVICSMMVFRFARQTNFVCWVHFFFVVIQRKNNINKHCVIYVYLSNERKSNEIRNHVHQVQGQPIQHILRAIGPDIHRCQTGTFMEQLVGMLSECAPIMHIWV